MSTQIEVPLDYSQRGVEPNTPDAASAELKRLRSTHPLWKHYQPKWNFYLAAYEGGDEFTTTENIFKHVREAPEDYADRLQRVHNLNYCGPLVDFYTNFIFSESIDRNGGNNAEFYNEFIKNVNRRGESVDDFMRHVEDDTQIFGMSYMLVEGDKLDASVADGGPVTEQVVKDQGLGPYWVLVLPDEVLDWVVDKFGNFLYVKRRQYVSELDPVKGPYDVTRYSEYYADRVVVTDVEEVSGGKAVILSSTTHPNPLGEVPFVVNRHKRDKRNPHMGLSFLRDFAKSNRTIMNLNSLLDEFLYRQAFNILAREVDTTVPLAEQNDGQIGTSNTVEYPKGATPPQYISPPVAPAEFIQAERARIKQEMFTLAAQDSLNEIFNGEKASGFSQAQSFSKTVPFISSRADALERCENDLMRLTMKMMGKEWDGKIKYKDRYEITNLTDALTQLLMLARDLQLGSETFVKAELKRLMREFDGKLPTDLLTQAEKEIDEFDFKDWMEVQTQALVGKGSSPGDQQKPKSTGTMQEAAAEAKAVNTAGTKKLKT